VFDGWMVVDELDCDPWTAAYVFLSVRTVGITVCAFPVFQAGLARGR